MRKNILILIVISLAFITLSFIDKKKKDYVPDEETAKKIAEAVWLPIYGEKIYGNKPFIVELMENGEVWYVRGTLHQDSGGVPYIKIRKDNCKVIEVTHDK